jgi:site-specific DNA-methyltransferase (adenine-specific)
VDGAGTGSDDRVRDTPAPDGTNVLAQCDSLDLERHVVRGSVQLAYLDPPFGMGGVFGARLPGGDGSRARGAVAYTDRWPSMEAYLAWLEPRIAAVRDALAPDGTMWLHLDHRAVHEAKVLCDRIYGRTAFLGEVIWATGNGARGARRGPAVTHQTLLLYAAGREFVWNARDPNLREPFAPTSLAMHFTTKDDEGRWYRERRIAGRTYRYYADEGRAIGSVWTDCPAMSANTPLREETTGYPTQKPLRLLERVVMASSLPGGRVVDPFCGSGTTLAAAARLGRSFTGCDVGDIAIETARRRLQAQGAAFDLRLPSTPQPCPAATRASSPSS